MTDSMGSGWFAAAALAALMEAHVFPQAQRGRAADDDCEQGDRCNTLPDGSLGPHPPACMTDECSLL